MPYLTPEHPDAFVDYPGKPRPDWMKDAVECPKCKGHGGWNLSLDVRNDPENPHFRMHCAQCRGHGWVRPENAGCAHEYRHDRMVGRCLEIMRCWKCGAEIQVDSSD